MPCLLQHERPASPRDDLAICGWHYWRIYRQLDPAFAGDPDAHPPEPPSIPQLYARLTPHRAAGTSDSDRHSPGFRSSSPASDHHIALTDHRSTSTARTWTGGDGRHHVEPPGLHHAPTILHAWANCVADERTVPAPDARIGDTAAFLLRHLEHACGQPWIVDMAGELDDTHTQLRSAVTVDGGGRRPIGACTLHDDDRGECGGALRIKRGDEVHCARCGAVWARENWLEGLV